MSNVWMSRVYKTEGRVESDGLLIQAPGNSSEPKARRAWVTAMMMERDTILSPKYSKPPVIQFPIARNRRGTVTAKYSGSRTLRIELSQGSDRNDVGLIQQSAFSPRSGSETVAKDFVIPVAWSTLLIDEYILTAAKLKTTRGKKCRLCPSFELLELLELLAGIEISDGRPVSD